MKALKFLTIGLFAIGLAFLAGGTSSAEMAIPVQLQSVGGSGASGTANLVAAGDGTEVSASLSGLQPGASYQVFVAGGTCAEPGASVAAVFTSTADNLSQATGSGPVRFRGTDPVGLLTLASGDHLVRIHQDGGADVACGPIPRVIGGVQQLPSTGGPGLPVALGAAGGLGLVLVAGGRFLRQIAIS